MLALEPSMKRKPLPPSSSKSSSTKSSSAKSPAAKQPRAATGQRSRAAASKPAVKKAKAVPIASPEGTSKQAQLIALLRSAAGASMADMMALTGWQSHTVRGMLSGALRKRLGLDVQCQRVDGVHLYRIVQTAAA
jgi:cell division septation protein DedD